MAQKKGAAFFLIVGIIIVAAVIVSRKMNIGKETEVYRPTYTAPTPPPPTPASHFDLKVNKFSVGEYDSYEVIGEIKNTDTRPFRFVEVKAVFLNKDKVAVGEETTYACGTDYILPGATKTFKFMGSNKPEYNSVRCSVVDCMEVK